MSDRPKFCKLASDKYSLISRNGNGYSHISTAQIGANCSDKRKTDLKLAAFYLTVACALIISDALGRIGRTPVPASDRYSIAGVTLVVHPYNRTPGILRIPFRLSNMGKHAVFYGVRPGTDVPIGQILLRDSISSKWADQSGVPPDQDPEIIDSRVTWIEMPPGGWIEGEFEDHLESGGDQVYAIFLKPDRNASAIRIISEAYRHNRQ